MSLLASLLLLIVAARLLGKLFGRYGHPELIGEILAGVLLGPALLGLIKPNPALAGVAELAVFLIILSAGLEMRFNDIVAAMRGRGMALALISFVLPFAAGAAVAAAFKLDLMRMIFLGLCISITALPVAVKLLDSLGILHTRIARYALATAVINDVAALFILGIVLNMPQQSTFGAAAGTVAVATWKLAALALVVLALNWLLAWLERRDISVQAIPENLVRVFGPEALFGIVIVFVLVFGTISEMLGFHFVIGAFFGALFLDKRHFLASRYEDLRGTLSSITGGFLAPVFFAYLGLEFSLHTFDDIAFPRRRHRRLGAHQAVRRLARRAAARHEPARGARPRLRAQRPRRDGAGGGRHRLSERLHRLDHLLHPGADGHRHHLPHAAAVQARVSGGSTGALRRRQVRPRQKSALARR